MNEANNKNERQGLLERLAARVRERAIATQATNLAVGHNNDGDKEKPKILQAEGQKESWTAQLLAMPRDKVIKKFGEEAVELVLAAAGDDKAAISHEAADVIYHLVVLLEKMGVGLDQVAAELQRREAQSGIEEKRGRFTNT